MYPWFLSGPHHDKEALELIIKRAAKHLPTPPLDPQVADILSPEAYEVLPENILDEVIIVRPTWLKDGDYTGGAKAGEGLTASTVFRGDVGRFIADCAPGRDEWVNKAPTVGQ